MSDEAAADRARAAVEDVWRREAPHVLAALARRGALLEDCEDAAQEALADATAQWTAGLPANPRGWLVTVASRRLVDQHRSVAARTRRELTDAQAGLVDRIETGRQPAWADRAGDLDDSLQLLLLCAHPSLPPPSAVALTLRCVAGLTTRQIATGLLLPEPTVAQRITRAKKSLRAAGATFGAVPPAELPRRLHAVRHVLHLVFTTGASTAAGPELVDLALTGEAVRLTERLHRAIPRDPETAGLLALMLLVHARSEARTRDGALVTLAEQDRTRWDHELVSRGVALLEEALPRGPVGPFQLQAAVAAVHATAATYAETDWPQILELYTMLHRIDPSPAVELARAIAVSEVHGAKAGLAELEPLVSGRPRDHRVVAARAHLLDALGHADAAGAYERAAALTDSLPEQTYLRTRAAEARRRP